MADATERTSESPGDDNLPSLVGRLGEQISTLLDLRISLLKVEIKEDVDAYVRRLMTIAVGGAIAIVGFALLNIALAFFVSTLFANAELTQPARYALGFIITGLVYLTLGSLLIIAMKNRLAKQGLAPRRSIEELKKDKQLVSSVVQS